jgi:hypothetical protein
MAIRVDLSDPMAVSYLGRLELYLRNTPGLLEKSAVAMINRLADKTRKEGIGILKKKYWASAGEIGRKIVVRRTRSLIQPATIEGEGRPLLLDRFKAKRIAVTSANGRTYAGVAAAALRENQPKSLTGAFFAISKKGPAGRELIFVRKEEERRPINVLYGPSMIKSLDEPEHTETLIKFAAEHAQEAMREAAEKELEKLGMLA